MSDEQGSCPPLRVRFGREPVSIALAVAAAAMCIPPTVSPEMTPNAVVQMFPPGWITAWFAVMFVGALVYLSGVLPSPPEHLDHARCGVIINRLIRERIGCIGVGWMLVSLGAGIAATGLHGVPVGVLLIGLSAGPGWRIRQTFVDAATLRCWASQGQGASP